MCMKEKLPFDMSFERIEKFVKNINVGVCPQGAKIS